MGLSLRAKVTTARIYRVQGQRRKSDYQMNGVPIVAAGSPET